MQKAGCPDGIVLQPAFIYHSAGKSPAFDHYIKYFCYEKTFLNNIIDAGCGMYCRRKAAHGGTVAPGGGKSPVNHIHGKRHA